MLLTKKDKQEMQEVVRSEFRSELGEVQTNLFRQVKSLMVENHRLLLHEIQESRPTKQFIRFVAARIEQKEINWIEVKQNLPGILLSWYQEFLHSREEG
jgi:hypothetical protein